MFDLLIIGGGPAGVSASLYAARGGLAAAIVYKDFGSLGKAERIENFYALPPAQPSAKPPHGKDIAKRGHEQARELGVEIFEEEITNISFEKTFAVNERDAKTVLLATGASHSAPNIQGLKKFEGHGVSYCAVCDGFFYRKRDVAVLGDGAYALHEAETLLPLVNSVKILTNGKDMTVNVPGGINVITEPVSEMSGSDTLESVAFENGDRLNISGLFVAVGVAGGCDLARKIGAAVKDNYVTVDSCMRTSVPGLWAAGDCTGGMKQISKAVYEGAVAGTDIIKHLRELSK